MDRLKAVLQALGNDKSKLVIDLSCRRKDDKWFVATNKWQTITDFELNQGKANNYAVCSVLTRKQTRYRFSNHFALNSSSTQQMWKASSGVSTTNSFPSSPNGAVYHSRMLVEADPSRTWNWSRS